MTSFTEPTVQHLDTKKGRNTERIKIKWKIWKVQIMFTYQYSSQIYDQITERNEGKTDNSDSWGNFYNFIKPTLH